ncbi:50S ribosomal protein L23 [Candidatus Peregrinibacteria bacterium]|jgi:large subunit ribosomal protein L23|nr:50S ribosomal protein L23 [Candidatus Peregrinibacteria bacterium]MBT4631623.1 50S ribosomal protein L23 [Candidatus Peregrinibacteria bacterium]MBT5516751.1 50S ribosomal protein L23 [Candidatus Peregrinibacteria bacterium]MBT5823967.1 50S ribosomal protein L23 [Candidatus Peregrinibacteria bacterium]
MNLSQVIVKPVLTEKSVQGSTVGKYSFVVHEDATKVDVKNAIQSAYGVKVAKINMLKGLPKFRWGRNRRPMQKRKATRRAIVTLKQGEKLDLTKLKPTK